MKKIAWLIVIVILSLILFSCASVNMNTPGCLDKGENRVGAYGLYLTDPSSYNNEDKEQSGIGSYYLKYSRGLGQQNEIGLGTGAFGGEFYYKHGFLPQESSFKIASLINLGYLYWLFPEAGIGGLAGYQFGNDILIYGGYRQHYILGDSEDVEENLFGHAIGGIEIFPDSSFSILFEYNRTLNEIKIKDWDIDESVYLDIIGFGFSFRF